MNAASREVSCIRAERRGSGPRARGGPGRRIGRRYDLSPAAGVAGRIIIDVRAVSVHALHDDARAFYTHFDFEPSPTDPLHLMLLIQDARVATRH